MSKLANLIQTIRTITGTSFVLINYTPNAHKLLKTSKIDGSINPFWDRKDEITKEVENMQVNMGIVYKDRINAILAASGKDADFVPRKGWHVEHEAPHKCLCQNKDRTNTYFNYPPNPTKKTVIRYMLDGVDISNDVQKYIPVKKAAKTQTDAGVSEDQAVAWNILDVTNITRMRVFATEHEIDDAVAVTATATTGKLAADKTPVTDATEKDTETA